MRGLSPKIISGILGEARIHKHNTYKHRTPYMKFKLKLLQIKCHVLEFTKGEALKDASKDNQSFAEVFISHNKHTLFTL
jgi:hypothetical protein